MQSVFKLSGKRTVTRQDPGELYTKAPKGQLLIFRKTFIESTKRIISKFISKNLSGKKTE